MVHDCIWEWCKSVCLSPCLVRVRALGTYSNWILTSSQSHRDISGQAFVRACACARACVCACLCVYDYVCVHVCARVRTCVCIWVCMREVCVCICVVRACVCVCKLKLHLPVFSSARPRQGKPSEPAIYVINWPHPPLPRETLRPPLESGLK